MKKTVFVTGANQGLGFEMVKQLAEKGFHVFLGARDEAKALEAIKKIGKTNIRFIRVDVTDQGSVKSAAETATKLAGQIDVLINNAGILLDWGVAPTVVAEEALRQTFETNLIGVTRVTQAFLPLLRKSKDARIINVSSTWGSIGNFAEAGETFGFATAYQISKSALNMWTAALSVELKKENISVYSMCPGWCKTRMGTENAPREAAQGAHIAVKLATDAKPAPTGSFFDDQGPVKW